MATVARNVTLSALASLANQLVRAAQQLLWVPLFLSSFGKEGYGDWVTIFGLAGYAAMSDFGVQTYWQNLLTGAHVRGDITEYRRIFRSGLLLFSAVGLSALAVVTSSTTLCCSPATLLALNTIPRAAASATLSILVVFVVVGLMASMIRGVFRTVGRNPAVAWFDVVRESILLGAVAFALVLRAGPVAVACTFCATALATLVFTVTTTRSRFPELVDLRLYRADSGTIKRLVRGASISFLSVLAAQLLSQGTLMLGNWALGAAAVAWISTSRTLSNLVRQAAGSIYFATLPEFSRLEAAGDKAQMTSLLRRSMHAVLLLSGAASVGLIGLGPWVFVRWTGNRFPAAPTLLYLFGLSVIVDAVRMPLHDFLVGCNRVGWVSAFNIIHAVTTLAAMWLLFPRMGALAVPVATIASSLAVHLPGMIRGCSEVLGTRVIVGTLRSVCVGAGVALLAAAPLTLIWRAGASVLAMLGSTSVSVLAFGALSWILVIDRSDASSISSRLARIMG